MQPQKLGRDFKIDHKAQGQTVAPVIVDLGKPPSGRLTPFNAYVALSRSRSRDEVRLLREFEKKLVTGEMNVDLMEFDEWLRITETSGI